MDLRGYQHQVRIEFSRPGKPTDNALVDSFNRTFRRECLNTQWFTSMEEATRQIEAWRQKYNASRPHRALQDQTPDEFARQYTENRDINECQHARKLALQVV